MNIDKAYKAYNNDVTFRRAVDLMTTLIEELETTPSELREMAMFACYLHESRKPLLPVYLDKGLCEVDGLKHKESSNDTK